LQGRRAGFVTAGTVTRETRRDASRRISGKYQACG